MILGRRSLSLASRLVLLFVLGSALIMAAAGYALYHALRMQLEAKDLAEVTGKTEVIEHLLREFDSPASLAASLQRFGDISVGHPHLSIGVLSRDLWLLKPREELLPIAKLATDATSPVPYVEVAVGDHTWWLHRVPHTWPASQSGRIDVILATDITETRTLLREHAAVAALVAVLGTLASALLAWFVARRGLAPLAQVAARAGQVTAQRLGARLDLHDAPKEVHGLADSINRMLERLEESFLGLEQFSADIAHELRTPLNNLLLQTQVTLSRPRLAEDYHDALHSNLVELERLQRMVSDMLFLARADRRMIELNVEELDLRAEVASVVDYFEAAAAEKAQTIVVTGEARLRGDRMMVKRALTNLLSNAVRYSPPKARIRVAAQSGPSGAAISVTNPGEALSEEELRRLFSRFARRDQSRGREVEGSGLGLSIVDSIMKLQGGSVEARSEGANLEFVLRFPALSKGCESTRSVAPQ